MSSVMKRQVSRSSSTTRMLYIGHTRAAAGSSRVSSARKVEGEHGAAAGTIGGTDLAAVIAHDLAHDTKAKAGALTHGLGCHPGLEEVRQQIGRDPLPRVLYFQPDAAGRRGAAESQRPAVRHRVERIRHEIEQRELELRGVGSISGSDASSVAFTSTPARTRRGRAIAHARSTSCARFVLVRGAGCRA